MADIVRLHKLWEAACLQLREHGVEAGGRQPEEPETGQLQEIKPDQLARMIDHTLLKPDATEDEVIRLCQEALKYQFASVCIHPAYVNLAAGQLGDSPVKVCTVIGFPLGATLTSVKAYETQSAVMAGAAEVDMVLNIGWLKSKKYKEVLHDIRTVAASAEGKAAVKVIIETALLSDVEKMAACLLTVQGGADFVKTSTGFASGGATEEDVRLLRFAVGPRFGVKASGGIRTRESAERMIRAGASRIGASASVAIVAGGLNADGGY